MKIAICYPPLPNPHGTPLLSQNRQFQFFSSPTYIYPVVPAQAASLLKSKGYEVVWMDGIAEEKTEEAYWNWLEIEKPDLIMVETKTPVVKRHWKFINYLKSQFPNLITVLVGDHVTALPEESMQNCQVDYILTGGDYDFLMLNLANHLTKKEKLEPGIWHRETQNSKLKTQNYNLKIKTTGSFQLNHDLNSLPFIDRELTKWQLYAYENGNYKRTPGTYVMAGRDCWWRRDGGCKFCAWTILYPQFRTRSVKNVLDEIGILIKKYQVQEIMDDTGTFPVGGWLKEFCQGMLKRGYHKKIYFDCNMRANILTQEDYNLMAKAGFRFLLYGLESANEKTLEKINKGIPAGAIVRDCQMAKEANRRTGGHLQPHATCMVGYPWESKKEAENTIALTADLFGRGLIDSLQATIVIPYPGTALFKECEKNNWLKTKDWSRYDMREPIMKIPYSASASMALTRGIYKSFLTPKFILKKIISIRGLEDIKFLMRGGIKFFGHLTDFSKKE